MKHQKQIQRAASESLCVRVDLIGDEGFDLDEPLASAWLAQALGEKSPYKPTADGHITVHLERVEQVIHVRGRVSASLTGGCVRCLGPVPVVLDLPIEVALFPEGKEPAAASDGEVTAEDMGVATYHGEEIDLAGLVRDEVFLELPMNLVCVESCAGLCPQCGTNLNEKRCTCAPEVDSRWQALRGLRVD